MKCNPWFYDGFTRSAPEWGDWHIHQSAVPEPRYPVVYGDAIYCGCCHPGAHGRRYNECWRGVEGFIDEQQYGGRNYGEHQWANGNWSGGGRRDPNPERATEKGAGDGDGTFERKDPVLEVANEGETKAAVDHGRRGRKGKTCKENKQVTKLPTQQDAVTAAKAEDGVDRLVVSGWLPVLTLLQGAKMETTRTEQKVSVTEKRKVATNACRHVWCHKCRRRGMGNRLGRARVERKQTRLERMDKSVGARGKHVEKDEYGDKSGEGGRHAGTGHTSRCNSGGDTEMASGGADDMEDVGVPPTEADDKSSNRNDSGSIDGGLCIEMLSNSVDTINDCGANDMPSASGTQAEKRDKCRAKCPMEEGAYHYCYESSWAKPEHSGKKEKGMSDLSQATTWAVERLRTWRQAWTRVVSRILREWKATGNKGHGGKETTSPHEKTSSRWDQVAVNGAYEGNGNGNWDATMATDFTDTHKLGCDYAQSDTELPERNGTETEDQHMRALDNEAVENSMEKGDKSKEGTWKKGHGDKDKTTSDNSTSGRWNHGVGTETSEANGKVENTTTYFNDTHKCGGAKANDERAPKRNDVVMEHQHRALDTEAAEDTMMKGDKRKIITWSTRSTNDKREAILVKCDAGKAEQYKVGCDKGKTRDGECPSESEDVIETHNEWPSKHAVDNNDECEDKEAQMASTRDHMDSMDGVDNDCNKMGDIDGRLCTETQKGMVDTECRSNDTLIVRATKAEKNHECCTQCSTEETEVQKGHGSPWVKSAQVCCDAKWRSHKRQVTTWAFKWWRIWRLVWTRVVSRILMEWAVTLKKEHSGQGTTFSYKCTSDRWHHVGIGTSDGNGNWEATRATDHKDTNKMGATIVQWETVAPKSNEPAKEHERWRLDMETAESAGTKRGKRKGRTRRTRSKRDKQEAAPIEVKEKAVQNSTRSGTDINKDRDSHGMEGETHETQCEDPGIQVSEYDYVCNEQNTQATPIHEDTDHFRLQRETSTWWTNTTRETEARWNTAQEDTERMREQRARWTWCTNTTRKCYERWKQVTCTNMLLRRLMHTWWAATTACNPCISSGTVECTCRLEREEQNWLGELRDSEIATGIAAIRNRCPRVRYGQERWIWLIEQLPTRGCTLLERWYKGKRTDFLYITVRERLYKRGQRPH